MIYSILKNSKERQLMAMKRTIFIFAIATVLVLCSQAAVAGVIKNGSFEEPGWVLWPPLGPNNCPNDWNDISLPTDKFSGWVSIEWSPDGKYSLTLYSLGEDAEFDVNEIGMISQHVPLTREVNEITFDIRLYTTGSDGAWDPNKRRAVVCIDSEVVWESNDVGSDVRDEYYDRHFMVPKKYKDGQLHKLSLGIRIDSNAPTTIEYKTDWDDVNSTTYCGGFGLLAADLDCDCYVDFFDFAMLADAWLTVVPSNDERNLFGGDDFEPVGFINFLDYAVYAGTYTGSDMSVLAGLVDVWLEEVESDNEYNLYTGDDLEPEGFINFFDFIVFAEEWGCSSYDQ
jgi:hypothetical protein